MDYLIVLTVFVIVYTGYIKRSNRPKLPIKCDYFFNPTLEADRLSDCSLFIFIIYI